MWSETSWRQFRNDRVYTLPVKLRAFIFVVAAGVAATQAYAQSTDISVVKTTVCDIVNHPSQFIDKTVEVRAQIWPDDRYPKFFWLNESSVRLGIGKVCPFLQASFKAGGSLGNQSAFGTFRGRIVHKLSRQKSSLLTPDPKGPSVIFLVDRQSDLYLRRDCLSGPIPILQLYDRQTGSFVRPQD